MAINPKQWTHKTQEAVAAALDQAKALSNPEITPDHVMAAIARQDDTIVPAVLSKLGLAPLMVRNQADEAVAKLPKAYGGEEPRMNRELNNVFDNAERYRKDFKDDFLSVEHLLLAMNQRLGVGSEELLQALRDVRGSHRVTSQNPEDQFQALEKYGQDLTKRARDGKIDPVIGRDEEIRRVIQVLSRRTKNNPVLIGEPGVGKTAIVEGLARRIADGDVPEGLKNKRLISLDIAALLADEHDAIREVAAELVPLARRAASGQLDDAGAFETVQQASGVDQAAETTLWPKRILDSTPSSRAVSRM